VLTRHVYDTYINHSQNNNSRKWLHFCLSPLAVYVNGSMLTRVFSDRPRTIPGQFKTQTATVFVERECSKGYSPAQDEAIINTQTPPQ